MIGPASLGAMVWDWSLDPWIIAAGMLSAMSCALLGNFLVLRRMSMMGDAISHAVLPGLAVAFLLFGSRGSLVMFLGAVVAGVLTALFTQLIHSLGKVEQSAAMGVVFTILFALGLIVIVRALDHVDLDPGCVLYGAIELAPLHRVTFLGWDIPRAVATLAPVFAVNVLFVALCFKEMRISSFDPGLSTVMGINSTLMHYVLMTLVAVTTVASFESVGSILVIAMLIVPAAAAHLLTDRLHTMIFVSVGIAALAAALGHVAALTTPGWFGFRDPVTGASLDTSTAGMMAVVAGVLFTVTMIAAPRHGLVSKAFHQAALRLRITREDVLGFLYRLEELGRTVPSRGSLPNADLALVRDVIGAGPLMGRLAVRRLTRTGHVRADGPALRLTDEGRAQGQFLLRSHRLWESYLHQYLNLAADHVHAPAERLEHITSPRMQQRLAERTDQPETDPQGKDIPPLSGPLRPGKPELVFYDGGCGLCHATVRFLLRRDTEGDLFAFAPLGGEAFSAHVPPSAATAVPDSILVLTRTGSMLTRSTAVLHLLERLGGFWAVAASSARSVPRPLRDACYRLVARIRNRLFAKPAGVCPRVPEHLRSRFRP